MSGIPDHRSQVAAPGEAVQRRFRQNWLVAIGSSAGGPAALATLLGALPADFPAAVVIVQHVDEKFAVNMAAWLCEYSKLPVRIAENADELAVGTVLLAGTRNHLVLQKDGRLAYSQLPPENIHRPSIDVFFHSVARYWIGQSVGVVLTGMGRDGALGLKALREKGYHTIAQDKATSAVYGMPKAAAELEAAVDVLPLARIAPRLIEKVMKS